MVSVNMFIFSLKKLACVADRIVILREQNFWPRNCKALQGMGIRRFEILAFSRVIAKAIPPATQAIKS